MRLAMIHVLMACTVVVSQGQEHPLPQSSIKSETDEVVVDVIVTDRKGHHVPGPQTIIAFIPPAGRDERLPSAKGAPAGEDAQTRHSHAQQARPAQLVTLVIDLGDMHFENLKGACAAAARFAGKTIGAGNSIALYWVDTSLHLAVPFTQDKQRVLDVLEKLGNRAPFGRLTARAGEIAQTGIADLFASIRPVPTATTGRTSHLTSEQAMQESLNMEHLQEEKMLMSWLVIASSFQARAVFVALPALASGYRGLPGRKSVVVFSEGFLHASLAESEMEAVIDAARRANVAIYVMDTSGLESGRRGELLSARVQNPDITDGSAVLQSLSKLKDADSDASSIDRYEWFQTLGSDLDDDLGWLPMARVVFW